LDRLPLGQGLHRYNEPTGIGLPLKPVSEAGTIPHCGPDRRMPGRCVL